METYPLQDKIEVMANPFPPQPPKFVLPLVFWTLEELINTSVGQISWKFGYPAWISPFFTLVDVPLFVLDVSPFHTCYFSLSCLLLLLSSRLLFLLFVLAASFLYICYYYFFHACCYCFSSSHLLLLSFSRLLLLLFTLATTPSLCLLLLPSLCSLMLLILIMLFRMLGYWMDIEWILVLT